VSADLVSAHYSLIIHHVTFMSYLWAASLENSMSTNSK